MEKIAIIDIGSNSARLVLVNVLDGGYFVVFDELKEMVRLGQDMDWDGFIKPQRIAQTIKTLTMFRRLCDANKVDKIFAYATAAVRRAKNQKSFLDEVAMTCGIKIKVLSPDEQAMLVYQGVINSMDIPKGLIMEMGGGSTNLIYYNRRNLIHFETLPFGAVTLTDLFKNDSSTPQERAKKIEDFIGEQLEKIPWLDGIEPDTAFVGVGGSFRNLGRISRLIKKYPFNMTHNYELPVSEFENIYNTIKKLDLNSTMKIKGLSSGRADIFPSACRYESGAFSLRFPKNHNQRLRFERGRNVPLCSAGRQRKTSFGRFGTLHLHANEVSRPQYCARRACLQSLHTAFQTTQSASQDAQILRQSAKNRRAFARQRYENQVLQSPTPLGVHHPQQQPLRCAAQGYSRCGVRCRRA